MKRKKEVQNGASSLRRLKLVQHYTELTIAKKTAPNFLVYDSMFVNSYCTT